MNAAQNFFDRAARRILNAHETAVPDLRDIVVILPNFHVARPLAQALMRVAKRPALLLPKMVTLNVWAQSIPIDEVVVTDCQRSALLYQLLRDKKWFDQADLWSMTQELLALFDELTYSLKELPKDAKTFAVSVQQAYQARQNSSLQLEASLVFELWHAMHSGEELDTARTYQMQLAKLASQASHPLFVLRTSDLSTLEQRYIEEYASNADVTVCDLREMQAENFSFISQALSLGGRVGVREDSLLDKSSYIRTRNIPALGDKLRFFASISLEQEARAASIQVRLWLQQGKQDIAIVAQDRVVARRMRALLERSEILVADETGWTFATMSVSTVIDRWLTALQSDFYHHDLLDLLKSPFIFADMASTERKGAVFQLEQLLRKQAVVAGLEKFIGLAKYAVELHQPLARLRQAAELLDQRKKKTLSEWLGALRESLRVLGIDIGLQKDDAGAQLLEALENWQKELETDKGRYRFNEWRRWLAQQLDTQTYRDSSIDSKVRFTHLAATRWRVFDAVLLLGCDANHLPSAADGGRWFNDAVRSSLDLPTRNIKAAQQRDDLLALLTLNDCVLVTWQKDRHGEAGLLSPFLVMLRDLHQLVYGDDLSDHKLLGYLDEEDQRVVVLARAVQPKPSMPSDIVPARISISAYNSLVACPYQFYARSMLRLNELDEIQEEIEKRDYGERVHDILSIFHERYKQVSEYPTTEMETALRQISEEIFSDLLKQDFAANAWLARWLASLPAYIEWQLADEAQGWRYTESESSFECEMDVVRLRGRIDRLDVNGEEKRVLDYKTQSDQILRNKVREPGEDVQLPCYAYAREAAHAAFVSIDNKKVKLIQSKQDLHQLARLNAVRLVQIMTDIRAGVAMPANGIDAACAYCEMRGLCRKGEWA